MGDAGDSFQERVWCDGCYDMVHFGHANSLRQAKALGDYLIVGVHSDEEINQHKGPAVFTLQERVKMLQGIKWVDEVVEGAPFITTLDTLDKYRCKFCAHGEDVTVTADGLDAYHEVKVAGRYKEVKRTPGVSTTDVVRRILQISRNEREIRSERSPSKSIEDFVRSFFTKDPRVVVTNKIIQSGNGEEPKELTCIEILPSLTELSSFQKRGKVVYVTGAFDLFHVGHLDFLRQAATHGDYLIVGLYTDLDIKRCEGSDYPIMSLHERALSLLACKYVSKVVMGAPFTITDDLMKLFQVDLVCHGQTPVIQDENGNDPYSVPKEQGTFLSVDSHNDMSTETIVRRIIQRRLEFEERNRRKEAKEKKDVVSEAKV